MASEWFSVVPPVVTLTSALLSRRIIPSLILGLLVGSFLVAGPMAGIIKAAEYLVASLASPDSIYIILFLFLFGSLAEIFKMSGGIKGFSALASSYVKDEKGALLSVWAATPGTFLDCCFHAVATGTIARPLVERFHGSKEKLAMVVNVTSSQLIVLIPVATTYVGYIMGITASAMRSSGIQGSPYNLYLNGLFFNFYSIGMVIASLLVIFVAPGFGRWRLGWAGKTEGGVHGGHEAHEQCEFEQRMEPRIMNLLLPLVWLTGLIVFLFWYTGREEGRTFWTALINADFEKAIFIAAFATLILTALFYAAQRIPLSEMESHFLSGGSELLPPIVVLVLSWSLSSVIQDLGFTGFITRNAGAAVPRLFVPASVFLLGALTSYFIGSSWATWALIMPLGLTLATGTGASLPLTYGAVLAGGSVGDNISPLGETPVLTSAVTDVPLLDHIQTTLPIGVVVIVISTLLFVLGQGIGWK